MLGVLIPAAEEVIAATKNGKVGVIATQGTVDSEAYVREIQKLDSDIEVFQQATPLLVPLVENNALKYAGPILDNYLAPLIKAEIDTLVLGCTHYPLFKSQLQVKLGSRVKITTLDEFIPVKLAEYLQRHPEIDQMLAKNGKHQFLATDITPSTVEVAKYLFGGSIELQKITLGV